MLLNRTCVQSSPWSYLGSAPLPGGTTLHLQLLPLLSSVHFFEAVFWSHHSLLSLAIRRPLLLRGGASSVAITVVCAVLSQF